MEWAGKKVLVTGSAGVIGRVLVKRLHLLGAEVLSIDVVPANGFGLPLPHVQVDLSKAIPDCVCAFHPEIVFHLAATFERTEETLGFWQSNFDNNVLSSHRLVTALDASPSLRVFLFASSYLVYRPELYLDVSEIKFLSEKDPITPRNLVALAKYFTERELEFVCRLRASFRAVSARIFRVYGCGSRDVISRWVRSALLGQPIEVYGSNNSFDYIYADDVAEGLIRLAACSGLPEVVNLGCGIARSVHEVASILEAELQGLRIKEIPWGGVREASCADMRLFEQLTGWVPHTSLEQGIQGVIAYERNRVRSSNARST